MADLLDTVQKYRLNTNEGENLFENHLKIDNTFLSPDEAADIVIEKYSCSPRDKEEREYRFGI